MTQPHTQKSNGIPSKGHHHDHAHHTTTTQSPLRGRGGQPKGGSNNVRRESPKREHKDNSTKSNNTNNNNNNNTSNATTVAPAAAASPPAASRRGNGRPKILVKGNPFSGRSVPHIEMPTRPVLSSKGCARHQLSMVQKYISGLQYNFLPKCFFNINKYRPMARLMDTAKEMVKECLPIRCLEASFLAVYLTHELHDVARIPLSFKTLFNGETYRHIVIITQADELYGALGLSRKKELMYKPLEFKTFASVLLDYKEWYAKYKHEVLSFKIGLPLSHDVTNTLTPCWKFFAINARKTAWAQVENIVNNYAEMSTQLALEWERSQVMQSKRAQRKLQAALSPLQRLEQPTTPRTPSSHANATPVKAVVESSAHASLESSIIQSPNASLTTPVINEASQPQTPRSDEKSNTSTVVNDRFCVNELSLSKDVNTPQQKLFPFSSTSPRHFSGANSALFDAVVLADEDEGEGGQRRDKDEVESAAQALALTSVRDSIASETQASLANVTSPADAVPPVLRQPRTARGSTSFSADVPDEAMSDSDTESEREYIDDDVVQIHRSFSSSLMGFGISQNTIQGSSTEIKESSEDDALLSEEHDIEEAHPSWASRDGVANSVATERVLSPVQEVIDTPITPLRVSTEKDSVIEMCFETPDPQSISSSIEECKMSESSEGKKRVPPNLDDRVLDVSACSPLAFSPLVMPEHSQSPRVELTSPVHTLDSSIRSQSTRQSITQSMQMSSPAATSSSTRTSFPFGASRGRRVGESVGGTSMDSRRVSACVSDTMSEDGSENDFLIQSFQNNRIPLTPVAAQNQSGGGRGVGKKQSHGHQGRSVSRSKQKQRSSQDASRHFTHESVREGR